MHVKGIWRVFAILLISNLSLCQYDALMGHQVWEVQGDVRLVTVKLLEEGLVDILDLSGSMKKIRVMPEHFKIVRQTLLQNILTYKILTEDLGTYLKNNDATRMLRQSQTCTASSCPQPLTDAYMSLDQIEWYLKELNSTHSDRVSVTSIGKSIEGRDIWQVHIKPERCQEGNAIWLEGGIHAREWISPAVTLQLIPQFLQDCSRLSRLDIYLVPMSNPDGYLYSWTTNRLWRKNRRLNSDVTNCDGVDLNRNWAYQFGVGASDNPCSDIYQGTSSFSEPETKALEIAMLKVKNNSNLLMFISFHSYSQLLLYPWGYTAEPAPNTLEMADRGNLWAKAVKDQFGKEYRVLNTGSGLYLASGTSDDWAKGVLNVQYSYTVELRDTGTEGFILDESNIEPCGKEMWEGIRAIRNAIGPSRYIFL